MEPAAKRARHSAKPPEAEQQQCTIVTLNACGLQRMLMVAPAGKQQRWRRSLKALLSEPDMHGDIVCIQEAGLGPADTFMELCSQDDVLCDWACFYSFARYSSAHLGVATFCRRSSNMPVAAEEGLCGTLDGHYPDHEPEHICFPSQEAWDATGLSLAERQMVDNCGESLVTDHGAFVLVNMHLQCVGSKWDGPEKGQEDKYELKLDMIKALQLRIDTLLAAGRNVVVVGDLNIPPHPNDHYKYRLWLRQWDIQQVQPEPLRHYAQHRLDWRWLGEAVTKGPMVDIYRSRQDAAKRAGSPGRDVDRYYTEQQAKRGNPEGTYIGAYAGPDQFTGSRVDHILAASGKLPTASGGDTGFVQCFCKAEIKRRFWGSDHVPVRAVLDCGALSRASESPELSVERLVAAHQAQQVTILTHLKNQSFVPDPDAYLEERQYENPKRLKLPRS